MTTTTTYPPTPACLDSQHTRCSSRPDSLYRMCGCDCHPDPPTKGQAACCNARRDDQGRPPIGFCSPTCERRPQAVNP